MESLWDGKEAVDQIRRSQGMCSWQIGRFVGSTPDVFEMIQFKADFRTKAGMVFEV